MRKIKVPEISNSSASVAIDSTGFKTTIRGDWLSDKCDKKERMDQVACFCEHSSGTSTEDCNHVCAYA